MEESPETRVLYGKLCDRERTQRIQKAENTIIVKCVDNFELQRNDTYNLQCNGCLAGNVMFILNAMNELVQDMLLVDFKDFDKGILNLLDDDEQQ